MSDSRQLLCETCGYVIGGLDRAGHCPECGRPISGSLPERRVGTPAQHSASWRAWRETAWAVLRRPRQSFSLMAARPAADRRFQSRTIVIASLLLAAPNAALLKLIVALKAPGSMAPWHAVLNWTVEYMVLAASIVLIAAAALTILTGMERVGTGVLSRTRSWRIPPPVANAICAHASVGWLVGAIAAAFLASISNVVLRGADPGAFTARVFFGVAAWGQLAAMTSGLMVFETWAYLGVRACRFANMPAESEIEPAPGSGNPSGA